MTEDNTNTNDDVDDSGLDDADTNTDTNADASGAAEIDELKDRLLKSQNSLDALTRVVTDADVAALLDAKEKGQSIRLVTSAADVDDDALPPLPDDLDLNALPPSEVVKLLLERIPAVVGGAVAETNQTLLDRLSAVEGELSTGRKTTMQTEVDALVVQYPDLPKYAEDIKELVDKSGLKIEEAYIIARKRKGKGLPTAVRTASERPTGITVRKSKTADAPAKKGARGFSDDLAECLARLVIPD